MRRCLGEWGLGLEAEVDENEGEERRGRESEVLDCKDGWVGVSSRECLFSSPFAFTLNSFTCM
jgi:hypothetical protein